MHIYQCNIYTYILKGKYNTQSRNERKAQTKPNWGISCKISDDKTVKTAQNKETYMTCLMAKRDLKRHDEHVYGGVLGGILEQKEDIRQKGEVWKNMDFSS